jgi:hypothetical protein
VALTVFAFLRSREPCHQSLLPAPQQASHAASTVARRSGFGSPRCSPGRRSASRRWKGRPLRPAPVRRSNWRAPPTAGRRSASGTTREEDLAARNTYWGPPAALGMHHPYQIYIKYLFRLVTLNLLPQRSAYPDRVPLTSGQNCRLAADGRAGREQRVTGFPASRCAVRERRPVDARATLRSAHRWTAR